MPEGDMWHFKLLQQLSQEIEDTRPAVISKEVVPALDELRRFRHLVRNVYSFNLLPDKMEVLVVDLFRLWAQVKAEVLAFADLLSELSNKIIP